MKASAQFEILNKLGLHARAAAQLVQIASTFNADLTVSVDGQTVNGKSIMGLMLLGAARGARVEVEAAGDDAEALLAAVSTLIEGRFNEE